MVHESSLSTAREEKKLPIKQLSTEKMFSASQEPHSLPRVGVGATMC